MSGDHAPQPGRLPPWLVYAVLMGLYLTCRGYHSFDGDQAYRLPLLLHWQDPQLYADDPFVRSFDAFNPHRGWLLVLDLATRPLGLATGLFLVFALTFGVTCAAVLRLARAVWPELDLRVGLFAIALVLVAKAGNIGTNHLFEAMVLDRQIAFAMGWLALAQLVVEPKRGRLLVMAAVCASTLVHPSAGLQIGLVMAASWAGWCVLGRWTGVSVRDALPGWLALGAAVIPGLALNLASGTGLVGDMPERDFWLLSVELHSPQPMLPHLWRLPQWVACCCYLGLAGLAVVGHKFGPKWNRETTGVAGAERVFERAPVHQAKTRARRLCPGHPGPCAVPLRAERSTEEEVSSLEQACPQARVRLIVTLALIVAGLVVAWFFIERLHSVRMTVFQPFRMATVGRGVALVLVSGLVERLWRRGRWLPRTRAILIVVAVAGDWLMVVVTLTELATQAAEAARERLSAHPLGCVFEGAVFLGMLALGLNFLGHHDTEYGHIPLLAAIGASVLSPVLGILRSSGRGSAFFKWAWTPRQRRAILGAAWALPMAALLAGFIPADSAIGRSALVRGLLGRWRFAAVPADDVERLGVWCRDHTPLTARFIGPPGPKTFRLWSQRSLAFNRAASPYHAAGLADWFARFQDHVGFHGRPEAFVQSYVSDRHGFEARYDRLSDGERAALALRQGAGYVVAPVRSNSSGGATAPEVETAAASELELLHVEGRYAVYRVKSEQLAQRQR